MLSWSHLYNAWFQHNLVSYGCSPQATQRSWALYIHAQASLYWNLHITEANEPSAWNDRLQAHHLICLLTCFTSGTMAVSLTGTASLTFPTKSQLTAPNNTPDELNTRLSLGKGTFRKFFKSQWLATHWGHCDLKLGENYPNLTCLATQKCGIHRLIHGSLGHSWQQPLYAHPPSHPGACFGSPQEGWVPILLLLLSLTVMHTHPSMSEQPYRSCSGTHTKNQTAITQDVSSWMLSLISHDHNWPLQ